MSAVQIERVASGYAVTRHVRNLPAALKVAELALTVTELAFEPVIDPAAARLAVHIEAAEADDPAPHDGRALFDNTKDED